MFSKIKKLQKNKFFRNVVVLASGTAAAQLITVIASPVITRLYGPEAFGIMSVFIAIINIIGPVAALTYPVAIVLPKAKRRAKHLVKLSFLISLTLAMITLIVLLFFRSLIVNIFNIENIEPYLYFIPLVIIFASMVQTAEQWLIRMNNFGVAAKVNFYQAIILNGSRISLGAFLPTAGTLVTTTVFGNLIKSLMMMYFSLGRTFKIENKDIKINKIKIKSLAKKYNDFPKYRAPQELINAATQGLPIILLSSLFSPTAAGFYSLGNTVLRMPTQLIGKSVGDVFYPKFTTASHEGNKLTPLIKKATFALMGVGVIPFGLLILWGPQIFTIVYGENWTQAGEYARWIAFASYVSFFNRPSVRALPVLKAQGFHLVHTIVSIFLRCGGLLIGFLIYKSDIVAIMLFAGIGIVLNLYLIYYSIKLASRKDNNYS